MSLFDLYINSTTFSNIIALIALLTAIIGFFMQLIIYLFPPPLSKKTREVILKGCVIGLVLVVVVTWNFPTLVSLVSSNPTPPQEKPNLNPIRLVYTYTGHSGEISSLAWADDKRIASSSDADGTIQIWNAATGTNPVQYHDVSFSPYLSGVRYLAYSPNGQYFASATNTSVVIWEVATGKKTEIFKDLGISDLVWSHTGQYVAFADRDGNVHIWDVFAQKEVLTYSGHMHPPESMDGSNVQLTWSPDSTMIASENWWDGIIQVWFVNTGEKYATYNCLCHDLRELQWSPNGQYIAFTPDTYDINMTETITLNILDYGFMEFGGVIDNNTHLDKMVVSCPSVAETEKKFDQGGLLSWSSTSRYLVVSCQKAVYFSEIGRKNTIFYSNLMNSDITAIAFSPNGKLIALGNSNGIVQIWQAPSV